MVGTSATVWQASFLEGGTEGRKARMAKTGNHGQIIPRDAELLRRLYWVQNHSLPEIGKMFGVTHKSVLRVFVELGVPTRPRGRTRTALCKCGQPSLKVKHAGNGSRYGTKCLKCRRAHYAKLAREYGRKPRVKRKKKIDLKRWYYTGAANPTGELQWLNQNKIMLRNVRRLLLKPKASSREALRFLNAASRRARTSPT